MRGYNKNMKPTPAMEALAKAWGNIKDSEKKRKKGGLLIGSAIRQALEKAKRN